MLFDLADEMGRKLSSSIDFIELDHARRAVNCSLARALRLLGAIVVEVQCLEKRPSSRSINPYVMQKQQVFRRFAYAASEKLLSSKRYKDSEIAKLNNADDPYFHDPLTTPGYWQWVYKYHVPVWLEKPDLVQNDKDEEATQNTIPQLPPDCRYINKQYNVLDKYTRSLIVIPFEHRIENSEGIWGFLNIEFDKDSTYSDDEYAALNRLADNIATIIWKAKAWQASKQGTAEVVKQFEDYCKSPTEVVLPFKTALFVSSAKESTAINSFIKKWCMDSRIQVDEFDLLKNKSTLTEMQAFSIYDAIKVEHFAIIDITFYQEEPELFLFLGMILSQKKPCILFHDKNVKNCEVQIPPFLKNILVSTGQTSGDCGHLLDFYFFELDTSNQIVFYNLVGEVVWHEQWKKFLKNLTDECTAYRMSRDFF